MDGAQGPSCGDAHCGCGFHGVASAPADLEAMNASPSLLVPASNRQP